MNDIHPYCDRLRKQFDDYHDGLVSPFIRAMLDRHLAGCASCREDYREFKSAIVAVRDMTPPQVPAQTIRRVIRRLTEPGDGLAEPGLQPGLSPVDGLSSV